LISLLPHFGFIGDVDISLEKNLIDFLAIDLKIND
jgi:hypothetical protein